MKKFNNVIKKVDALKLIMIINVFMMIMIPYLSQRINNIILLLVELLNICCYISYRIKINYKYVSVLSIFIILTLISTFINFGFSTRLLNCFVTGLKYLLFYLNIRYLSQKYDIKEILDYLFKIILVILVITDFSVAFTLGNGIGKNGILPIYIIGNKFTVSYLHMLLLSLYPYQKVFINNKNKIFITLSIFSLIICKIINCNTGIIGIFIILILKYAIDKNIIKARYINNSIIYISMMCILTFIIINFQVLANNFIVKFIVEGVLKRNLTLTGRIEMYNIVIEKIKSSLFFGNGFNSTYVEDILGWGNPQNGLLKMLLDYGMMGTLGFFALIYDSFGKIKSNNYIIVFLIGMLVCSIVEINISAIYFLTLAIVKSIEYSETEKDGVMHQ